MQVFVLGLVFSNKVLNVYKCWQEVIQILGREHFVLEQQILGIATRIFMYLCVLGNVLAHWSNFGFC